MYTYIYLLYKIRARILYYKLKNFDLIMFLKLVFIILLNAINLLVLYAIIQDLSPVQTIFNIFLCTFMICLVVFKCIKMAVKYFTLWLYWILNISFNGHYFS